MRFFQISLKKSELKTTHNTFRDCRVHFFDNLSQNGCKRDGCKAGTTVYHFGHGVEPVPLRSPHPRVGRTNSSLKGCNILEIWYPGKV